MPKHGEIDDSYPATLERDNKLKLLEPFKGAKMHHIMQCMVCSHEWSATPISKRQAFKKYGTSGCPACNETSKNTYYSKKRTKHLTDLADRGITILTPGYDGRRHLVNEYSYDKIRVKNEECGHTFYCSPSNLLTRGVICSVCGPTNRTKQLTAWSKSNSANWQLTASVWQKYKATVTALTEQTYKEHKTRINPTALPRGKAGVEGAYHLDHIVPKRFCFDNNIPPEVCADPSNLQMIGWRENVGSRDAIKGSIPPLFFQYIATNSKMEAYATSIQSILPNCELFCKIGNTVATAYDKESNRAILVIPLDQSHANMKIALNARAEFIAADVSFIILFEDEMSNITLLKSKLLHYTHGNIAQRIHARQCIIGTPTIVEKRELLNANHVQRNDNAPISMGAYYAGNLVAIMTFSKPRVALGQKGNKNTDGIWELSRFCTDVNYRIPGVASKLLKAFKQTHQWKEIYSYADKRWSTGNMYTQLGFEQTANNPPDYFYVVDGTRKHRWNYRKDIIKNTLPVYDAELTEYQNMVANGMWRVWDCGTLKYTIYNPTTHKE